MLKFLRRFIKEEVDETSRLQEQFGHFRRLLTENNQALEIMADMEEKLSGDFLFDTGYLEWPLDGGNPALLGLRKIICIGEPVRTPCLSLAPLGTRLEECWGAHVFGTYASTEMATTFPDCEWGMGGHLPPGMIVVEIVDDEGRVLPPGEPGEVVATPLGVTGMPLLRFKTGDIATLHTDPCRCGRNSWRLGPIIGRKSQMLKYHGTTVYPPAIYSVLQGLPAVRGYYIEVRSVFDLSDSIRVVVGAGEIVDPGRAAALIRDDAHKTTTLDTIELAKYSFTFSLAACPMRCRDSASASRRSSACRNSVESPGVTR